MIPYHKCPFHSVQSKSLRSTTTPGSHVYLNTMQVLYHLEDGNYSCNLHHNSFDMCMNLTCCVLLYSS
jgi:hypothetical protein